jgi:hypothetical protein
MSADRGDLAGAEHLLRENAVKLQEMPRIDALARVSCLFELAEVMNRVRPGAARQMYEPVAASAKRLVDSFRDTVTERRARAEIVLGGCLKGLGRYDEAEPVLLKGYDGLRKYISESDAEMHDAFGQVMDLYRRWGKPDKVAEHQRQTPRHFEGKAKTSATAR